MLVWCCYMASVSYKTLWRVGEGIRKKDSKSYYWKGTRFRKSSFYGKKNYISEVDPWCVCDEQVYHNSLWCKSRQTWFRLYFSDVHRHVILILYQDFFVCRICVDHNSSAKEKVELKSSEYDLEEGEIFSYLSDMFPTEWGLCRAFRLIIKMMLDMNWSIRSQLMFPEKWSMLILGLNKY